MVAPLVVFFLTLMGFVSLSLQPRRCLKTLSEAVTYTASWWRKKGDFRGSKVFPPNSWLFWCLCGDWRPTACSSAEAPVVEGDFSNKYHASISYPTPTISLVFFFNIQQPLTKSNLVTFNSSRWMGSASSFGSTRWIDGNVRNPKFEQGPRYYVFSNGNSDCNLYFYFAQIAQCMVYLATCPKTTKM